VVGARKIAVVASASGNGKTTVGIEIAQRVGVRFVELDALVHGPGWIETPDAVLHEELKPLLALDGWVIDGTYQRKLGNRVLDAAELIVWLDLPLRVWLPRLARRTWRRLRGQERLWNDNHETLSSATFGRDSLFVYALRSHFRRRRDWPRALAGYRVVRLRSSAAVQRFLAQIGE
jgi:adenylate kinase family enzyme